MSDELDLVKTGTHAVAGIGSGGLVAIVMSWFRNKEAQEAREEFVNLRADVKHILADLSEHKKVFEDVVETKLSVKAMHSRQDEFEKRLERLEAKRR